MSELSEKLDYIARRVRALREEREEAITSAPQTFEDITVAHRRAFSAPVARYVVVLPDGRPQGHGAFYAQRPAALRQARVLKCHVYDSRERVVIDPHTDEVVWRAEAAASP